MSNYYPALIAALALISVTPAGAQAPGSSANLWSPSGRSPLVRGASCFASTCATLTDGRTLAAAAGSLSLEIYDPASGKTASYPSPRAGVIPVVLPSANVLLVGGMERGTASRAVDLFDPSTNSVAHSGFILTPRTGFTATALPDGSVLIAGGRDVSGTTLSSVEIYDPAKGVSSYAGEMLVARHDHAAAILANNNQVLLAGGADGDTILASAELFTPWTGTFTRTGSLTVARQGVSTMAVPRAGTAFIDGGSNATGAVAGSEVYSYATLQSVKPVYGKGQTVAVSGDGWAAGRPVALTFQALRDPQHLTSPFHTSVTANAAGHIAYGGFSSDLMQGQPFSVTADDGLSLSQNFLLPETTGPDSTSVGVSSIAPAPPVTGQAFSIKATVLDTTVPATTVSQVGSVSFVIDSLAAVVVPVGPDGTATLVQNPGTLAAGSHTVAVSYTGTAVFASSAGPAATNFTVAAAPTLLTVSGNAGVPYGTNATIGASITIPAPGNLVAGALNGTIVFKLDGNTIASCPAIKVVAGNLGPYTCTQLVAPTGTHAVTATFTPASNYSGSSATLTGGVTFNNLTLPAFDLLVGAPSRAFRQAGTLTAQVTGISSALINAADTVQFQIDGVSLGAPVTAASGIFSISDSAAGTVGSHTITAIFSGDANIAGITNTASQAISAAPTATVLAATSAGPFYIGSAINFTATVATVAPASIAPVISAGSVSFFVDGAGTPFATVNVGSAGTAATTISTLPVSSVAHTITAVYNGTPTFVTSTSAAASAKVQPLGATNMVTSGANPSTFGNNVVFTVTVAPTAGQVVPSGTVLLQINGSLPGFSASLTPNGANGVATVTVPGAALPVGVDTVTVTYSGDSNFGGSSGSVAGGQTVNANVISTTTTINTPTSANIIYGQQVQLPAVVSANPPSTLSPPNGALTFADVMSSQLVPLPGQSVFTNTVSSTYITNSLIVGTHKITAAYAPPNPQTGNTFLPNTSAPVIVNVAKAPTTIALTDSGNGNFTAIVRVTAPGGGIPTGTVAFVLNGNSYFNYGTIIQDAVFTGGAQFIAKVSGSPVNGNVTAVYAGDTNFLSSTSAQLVESAPSQTPSGTTLTTSLDPATIGQTVTFTATATGSKGVATGTVVFNDGNNVLGTSPLNGAGVATLVTSSLSGGTHAITAVYSGDQNYSSSNAAYGQQILKLQSVVSLSSSAAAPVMGQAIVFTVKLGPVPPAGYSAQTGTLTLLDSGTVVGTAAATAPAITVASLLAGTHYLSVQYSGDGTWNPSSAPAILQSVGKAPTSTNLTSAPAAANQQIVLTATVTAGSGIPTGTVTFVDPSQSILATATLVNGIGTASVKPGSTSVAAIYSGDNNYLSSTSGGFNELKAQNAASFTSLTFAPNEIVSLFGSNLSPATGGKTSAVFTKLDSTTQGSWKGMYGADGAGIAADTSRFPSYAQVTLTAPIATWTSSTTDPRGLQTYSGSGRQASAWYGAQFSVDVNLTDGNTHQVAMYCVDWDLNNVRLEKVDVLDAATGAVLDSRGISSFSSGEYLVWNLSGHVTLRVTAPSNAVASAIFFDPASNSSSAAGTASVSVSDSTGKTFQAKLYYASPTQINFVMPSILAPGPGVIQVSNTNGANFTTAITIAATSPGLFSADGTGQGLAAAILFDLPATGTPTTSFTANCNTAPCSANAIAPNSTGQFYLELFGTGISNALKSQITATINGIAVPVSSAGPQSQYAGLDQVNIGPLPLSLQGAGNVNVALTVNGTLSNTVTVTFQ